MIEEITEERKALVKIKRMLDKYFDNTSDEEIEETRRMDVIDEIDTLLEKFNITRKEELLDELSEIDTTK
jgi:hypothetical protein